MRRSQDPGRKHYDCEDEQHQAKQAGSKDVDDTGDEGNASE